MRAAAGRPHPGARIETHDRPAVDQGRQRRPHPGARIETPFCRIAGTSSPVAPTRGRGSKRCRGHLPAGVGMSPPPGGADRNVCKTSRLRPGPRSPPPGGADRNGPQRTSIMLMAGRPHPGARIETTILICSGVNASVAPTRGRGSKRQRRDGTTQGFQSPPPGGADRNIGTDPRAAQASMSPPPGGADRNVSGRKVTRTEKNVAPTRGRGSKPESLAMASDPTRSPPPGGADRNSILAILDGCTDSGRPHPGARIETVAALNIAIDGRVAPTRGRGSKRWMYRPMMAGPDVAPTRGRGSKHHGCGCPIEMLRSPPPGGADRNSNTGIDPANDPRSPPPGGADRNELKPYLSDRIRESPPPGGADRNDKSETLLASFRVSPPPGGADRNRHCPRPNRRGPQVAPTRGRGSKPELVADQRGGQRVAPTRGRGSKRDNPLAIAEGATGRPHPGARIETSVAVAPTSRPVVAPTRGRGSKHLHGANWRRPPRVAPTRGRGSKHLAPAAEADRTGGRPHPGARIETRSGSGMTWSKMVAPTRGRGSKRPQVMWTFDKTIVAPTRGRGSKRNNGWFDWAKREGRPHPGARIETA